MNDMPPFPIVKGNTVDAHTRCMHYHSPLDVVAIKFKCCGDYYPCYSCHVEQAAHTVQVWPKIEFSTPAILCGMCRKEMTISEYKNGGFKCPHCKAAFNPGCSRHDHFYFEQ